MSATLALVNGESLDCISVSNRGLAYGDGVFTTTRVVDQRVQLWPLHRRRLLRDCEKLSLSVDFDLLECEVATLCKQLPPLSVVKIILTRSENQRGYRPFSSEVVRVLQAAPLVPYPGKYSAQGVAVTVCRLCLADIPTLAGVKHLNRLEQVLARSEWEDEYQEGVMLDRRGSVVEGTMSNVFIVEGDQLLTPTLNRCGVAGVMREHIVTNAERGGFEAHEVEISLDDLYEAKNVFLCNALIGAWPVASIDSRNGRDKWECTDMSAFIRKEFTSIQNIVGIR